MLSDTAVAVHPEDERYQSLIGKTGRSTIGKPWKFRLLPMNMLIVIWYRCSEITPAHDFNDYEVGKRHSLPMVNVLTFKCRYP